jgi:hypothetical protein
MYVSLYSVRLDIKHLMSMALCVSSKRKTIPALHTLHDMSKILCVLQ